MDKSRPLFEPTRPGVEALGQVACGTGSPPRRLVPLLLAALALGFFPTQVAWGFISFGNGFGNKWGAPEFGTGAVVTWGYMLDGTGVDPGFRIDPFSFPDRSGVIGTSQLSTLQSRIDTAFGTSAFHQAIERAFATWSRAADIQFVGPIIDQGLPVNDPGAEQPDIRIGAFKPDPEHSFRFVAAVGFAPPYNGGTLAGDILFNLDAAFQVIQGVEDTTPINYALGNDLEGLVLHELGHAAIGLAHPPSGTDSVMYVGAGCCQTINHELAPDDVAGARFTYGVSADLNQDGAVDAADAGIMFSSWGQTGVGDLNDDLVIDAADAGILFARWTGDAAWAVPEPQGPAALCGLLGLIHRRRARRAAG